MDSSIPPPIFEPRYLNIDFLFNQVYIFFHWLFGVLGFLGEAIAPDNAINGVGGSGTDTNGLGRNSVENNSDGYSYNNNLYSSSQGGQNSLNSGVGFDDASFYGQSQGNPIFTTSLSILSILLITIIIYSFVRLREIRKEQEKELAKIISYGPEPTPRHEKWQIVLDHLDSANPSEWKLAILEADNMLDEMVRRMGYSGENLGERLKTIEPSDFSNIQSAWEAHKVRNKIAHEGSEFFFSHREAKRIVGLYEEVFREFEFI
ncbi:MAG: hypothetical protein A2648_01250 [Candidatus Lloydbacteria bacterium RIFCSPHIGHO2_01_FULL_41_20]|uniref:Uncharacterized protein n=1 Tax=Candidatus Lloydbacteria bacterium RIFCSPHIGHO2_01_FULL_41_20 TaxID=1798657 RepID=A0A1G2CS32_9BACT|nr:MAG: hypothetical protein A2648_01250 [Candidatus Lloydbacteria bacterium RIFCSPHIGHO2_01_FULL_41_20]